MSESDIFKELNHSKHKKGEVVLYAVAAIAFGCCTLPSRIRPTHNQVARKEIRRGVFDLAIALEAEQKKLYGGTPNA